MNFNINYFNDQPIFDDGQILTINIFDNELFNEDDQPNVPIGDQIIKAPGVLRIQYSSLGNLLYLVSEVNPDIQRFFNQILKLEQVIDMKHLGDKIIYGLYRSLKPVLKRDLVRTSLYSLFKKKISNISDFYCRILSVYMSSLPLQKALNSCLKNRDLSKSGDLFPYLVCLCKAFFCGALGLDQANQNMNSTSLDLYRVLEVDEEVFYNRKRGQKITLKEFALFQAQKPRAEGIRGKVCLCMEIPARISKIRSIHLL